MVAFRFVGASTLGRRVGIRVSNSPVGVFVGPATSPWLCARLLGRPWLGGVDSIARFGYLGGIPLREESAAVEEVPVGLVAARKLVEWGARVVPGFVSASGAKVPLGGNWVQNASREDGKLVEWWERWPYAWVGVVSGVDSLLVLDCDGPLAVEWLRDLVARECGGGWSDCAGGWVYKTPGRGGGLHCLWRWPPWLGHDFRQAKVRVDGGGEVQIRGNGHFTLVAGARRKDGKYEVVEEPGPGGPVVAPERLIRALLRESMVSTTATDPVGGGELIEISPEEAWKGAPYADGRKNLVAGLAWWMAIRGWDANAVADKCVLFGVECCSPSLDEETCRKKAEYAVERAAVYKEKTQREMEEAMGSWVGGRLWRG